MAETNRPENVVPIEMLHEVERLQRWQKEAIAVIEKWDNLIIHMPRGYMRLGEYHWDALDRYIKELKSTERR